MSVDLQVDFSSVDFWLFNSSVAKAIDSVYPDANLNKQDLDKYLGVINDLAKFCSQRDERDHKIPKVIKGTIYKDLGIEEVIEKIKIFLFRNDESVTVYFYPRRLKIQEEEADAYKKPGSVIKIDIPLNNQAKSTFREASQVVRYILQEDEQHDDSVNQLIDEFEFRRKLIRNSSFTIPYHYAFHPTNDNASTKFRVFEEKYKSDFKLFSHHYQKKKKDKRAVKVFYYLTKALHDLHMENIFHGGVKLENFRCREFGKNVVISGTDFSTKLEHSDDTIICEGKTPFLSGYESIVDMLDSKTFSSPRQGLPSDVWALGCALYKFLRVGYPGFERLIGISPKLNSMCYRLSLMVDLLSAREPIVPSSNALEGDFQCVSEHAGSDVSGTNFLQQSGTSTEKRLFLDAESPKESRKLLEQVKEAWNSTKLSDSLSTKIKDINEIRRDAKASLSKIEPNLLGNLLDDPILIGELERLIASLCTVVQKDLLGEPIVSELNHPIQDPVLINLYQDVSNKIIKFNDRFLSKLRKAKRVLRKKMVTQDPLMKLIKKMMHPDPSQRIKTQKALAFLEKKFPEIIKPLKPGK